MGPESNEEKMMVGDMGPEEHLREVARYLERFGDEVNFNLSVCVPPPVGNPAMLQYQQSPNSGLNVTPPECFLFPILCPT